MRNRRIVWIGLVLALAAGNLGANVVSCSLDGGAAPAGGCYATGAIFGSDILDWGTANALGEAYSGTTSNGSVNPLPKGSSWNVSSTFGVPISVSLDASSNASALERADNNDLAWDGPGSVPNTWQFPQTVLDDEGGSAHSIIKVESHFGAPTTGNLNQYNPAAAQFGDHLIATVDNNSNVAEGGPVILNFSSTPLTAIGFRISAVGSSNSSDFDAVVTATFTDLSVHTYSIVDSGDGGECTTLFNPSGPVPCNNAPWIGFVSSTNNIQSISVQAFAPGTTNEIGFMMDTLQLSSGATSPRNPGTSTPEPASVLLLGAGLLGLAGAAKKLRA